MACKCKVKFNKLFYNNNNNISRQKKTCDKLFVKNQMSNNNNIKIIHQVQSMICDNFNVIFLNRTFILNVLLVYSFFYIIILRELLKL